MNSGIGGGMAGQRSIIGKAQSQAAANDATRQPGQGGGEMSAFMQTVAQMALQQSAMMGSSIVSNMRPDLGGDE